MPFNEIKRTTVNTFRGKINRTGLDTWLAVVVQSLTGDGCWTEWWFWIAVEMAVMQKCNC